MNIYHITNNPKKTFERIKQDVEISQSRINIYVACIGIIIMFYMWFMKYDNSIVSTKDNSISTYILVIVIIILSSFLSLILFRAISWLTFLTGKALKGKAEIKQIQLVLLYATLFAIAVTTPFQVLFKLTSEIEFFVRISSWFILAINILVFLVTTRISIIGLSVFNQYSYTRGALNYAIFIIFGIFQMFG